MTDKWKVSPQWNKDVLKAKNGVVANFQNNTFGTNANEIIEIKDLIYRSANSGTFFENPIVSTRQFTIPTETVSLVFSGSIMTYDGTVHFGPGRANYGIKITPNGQLSTYGLVRAPGTDIDLNLAHFAGAVLSPDGSVHFVPYAQNEYGQKVLPNGSTKTYSLVSNGLPNTAQSYNGGVLGPDGKIYIIPYRSPVGLVIDPQTDTTSTYSLVYTTEFAYAGGCLAPDGTIHMAPAKADRGQKITVSGGGITVSTYPLVYTLNANLFNNGISASGVLAPDGTVYFIPWEAEVGQKINVSNGNVTVSTYSLVYTTGFAYNRAVLGADGAIHFAPYNANIGQKINANGTVSTYPLVFTSNFTHVGGVLKADGTIDMFHIDSLLGLFLIQNINTGVGYPLPPGARISQYYNHS